MHIVHIYKDYYPVLGGIENHVKALAEGLAKHGHRVTVLVTNTTSQDHILQQDNLTIIKAARLVHLASTPLSLRMLWHAASISSADVIDLHFPYPPADLVSLLVPGKPPLVVSYHSDIVRQKTMLRAYRPLLNWTLQRADRIVATSNRYIASSPWLRPHHNRCSIAPYSVDLARFSNPSDLLCQELRQRYGTPLILFVGKLRYYKGLHFLLEAMRMMHTPAHLLLVGNGPKEQALRSQANELTIEDRVHFLGEVSNEDLPNLYHAADAFVLPSHLRAEAFGIVQLEAQAARLPIVCTELGTDTSTITQHGKTGFVVPPADPPALAKALDALLCNPDMARWMGNNGRLRAETEFSHERMVERMEMIYQDVVAKRTSCNYGA
jgi:rhamnosyl/mannosyltransferase